MNFTKDNLLLYAVTDRSWLNGETLAQQVEKALKGGATIIQLREKNLSYDEFLQSATEIKKITEKYNVPLIINDNVEIALKADADGVHLGQGDMSAAEARKILGKDKIIGVSARTCEQAKAAEASGADYLGVGAVFSTSTKTDAKPLEHEMLKKICDTVSIPIVAIGGISQDNILQLMGTHISGVAVVSALFAQDDITNAARELLKKAKQATIQGAIFDLDGTLIDSMPLWDNIGISLLESLGATPLPDLKEQLRPMSLEESCVYIKKEYSLKQTPDELLFMLLNMVKDSYRNVPLKNGVKEMLSSMKGVKKYICTLTEPKLAQAVLERNGVWDYFDGIVSATEYSLNKSTSALYDITLAKLGTPKECTYIFEDSLTGITSAKKGGYTTVGIYDECADYKKVQECADFFTTDYKEWYI